MLRRVPPAFAEIALGTDVLVSLFKGLEQAVIGFSLHAWLDLAFIMNVGLVVALKGILSHQVGCEVILADFMWSQLLPGFRLLSLYHPASPTLFRCLGDNTTSQQRFHPWGGAKGRQEFVELGAGPAGCVANCGPFQVPAFSRRQIKCSIGW